MDSKRTAPKSKKFKSADVESSTFSALPKEILVKIFDYYVKSEGVCKLYDVVSKVCKHWKAAAQDPYLLAVINDNRISKNALLTFCRQGMLKQTQVLDLCHLGQSLKSTNMMLILKNCPKLRSLHISDYHPGYQEIFLKLPEYCPNIETLDLSPPDNDFRRPYGITMASLMHLLQTCGGNIKCLNFSGCAYTFAKLCNFEKIAPLCPNLEEFYLNGIFIADKTFPLNSFQYNCPKLKVLSLSDFYIVINNKPPIGFPNLQKFVRTADFCSCFNFHVMKAVLGESCSLKTLDLTGCSIDLDCLLSLSATDLEDLWLSKVECVPYHLMSSVIEKWKHSLRTLDLSVHLHSNIVEAALKVYVASDGDNKLESVDLHNTNVTLDVLLPLIEKCAHLWYLNLESCRSLPRGIKRIYRTREDILDICEKCK